MPESNSPRTLRAYPGGGADLVWYGATGDRTRPAITGLGILGGFRGMLVRDGYGGYVSYDTRPTRARQCLAHLCSRNASRGGDGVVRLRPSALDVAALTSRTRWAERPEAARSAQ